MVVLFGGVGTPPPTVAVIVATDPDAIGVLNVCTPVKVLAASVRAMVAVVVGNVYVCPAVPVYVLDPVVNVLPFTVVGVIAPRVNDSAPSVFEALTPLPVVTRFTSVPVVAGKV